MECRKCRVADYCPSKGSSPLIVLKKRFLCVLVGGYGKVPVDPGILSDESRVIAQKQGGCLTLAEIPTYEDEIVTFKLTKIFSPPQLSAREATNEMLDRLYPKSSI